MRRLCAALVAAGLSVPLAAPAWAAIGPQPASGTLFVTAPPVISSTHVADGSTVVVVTLTGTITGTFAGSFTETDRVVTHADGRVTLEGKGMLSGRLGTCGTGSVAYEVEAQGTVASVSGRFQTMSHAASTSTPMSIHSVDTYAASPVAGAYTGTYHCT